uniref:Uncharacterized protein AlNc14C22G2288 n=1 Tax=Albugo laibachii Nc14 TaxID=890382 RepID=F0W5Y0_9STRA|nr:conserved hypothetical protein [Albugo laibachii Nc14]|eukprot:CCA16521.1 conserved hypothetical protein [Albugo laibachii Nc14]
MQSTFMERDIEEEMYCYFTRPDKNIQILANGDIVDCSYLPESARHDLYKTELCKHFMETSICRYGPKCQFAHGMHELRGVVRHPKYKTTRCKTFLTTGKCTYGSRCRFIHERDPEDFANEAEMEKTIWMKSEYCDTKNAFNMAGVFQPPLSFTSMASTECSMDYSTVSEDEDFDLNFQQRHLYDDESYLSFPEEQPGADNTMKYSRLSVFRRICQDNDIDY